MEPVAQPKTHLISPRIRWRRLMTMHRRRRFRCQIRTRFGLIAAWGKRKGSPRRQLDSSIATGYSYLPEDIQRHIHTLMPLRDAAQAACVSHAFLSSWRSRPNLTFSKEILGLDENVRGKDEIARDFPSIIDHILKKHSGCVKRFELLKAPNSSVKDRRYLNSWLHIAVTPGIEELTLSLASSMPSIETLGIRSNSGVCSKTFCN